MSLRACFDNVEASNRTVRRATGRASWRPDAAAGRQNAWLTFSKRALRHFWFALAVLASCSLFGVTVLEDFESAAGDQRWTFSNGQEFPGAKGSFARTQDAAHESRYGGKLAFDFEEGGRYVSAIVNVSDQVPTGADAVRFQVRVPEGCGLQFRYTDRNGQTFQKPVDCTPGKWDETTVFFGGWADHWGGPNDGKPQGPPKSLAWVLGHGALKRGELLLDNIRWARAEEAVTRVAYPAYRFGPEEGWTLRAEGDGGASKLEGNSCLLDFSKGARSISLSVPDRILLGNVEKLVLKARGSLAGHPVRLVMRTHFMTFHRTVTNWSGDADLVIGAPPGEGWQWQGGENDGKIHGPLRLAEIQFRPGPQPTCELKLNEFAVESSCPKEKQCLLIGASTNTPGGPAFVATVRALSVEPLRGELKWTFRDWERNEVGRGAQGIEVPPLGQTASHVIPLPASETAERKYLEAEFDLVIPGQRTAAANAAWLAPMAGEGDARLEPASPFGMGLYLNRYRGDAAGLALMERAARMARDAGVKWSREDFSWSRIEPRKGQFQWDYYDELLACAKRNGITVYAIVGYWSGWTQPYTEAGLEDYVRYLRELVKRYKRDIKQWEIWNEPNIFFWQGPRDMYADLLKRSYAAVKELDPEAQVLGLSTAGIDSGYIRRMLELKAPFDILTIHPYRKHLDDRGFIKDLEAVSDLVRLPDGRRRPVWLTEMGWATHTPHHTVPQDFAPNTLRAQAELITRSYLCAIASGVEPRTFWYNFRNDGEDPVYFEHQMGIVYHDFRPKPAYAAYANLTRVLKGMRLDGPVNEPDGVLAYRFKPRSGSGYGVVVAWNPAADGKMELPTDRPMLRVNVMGESTPLTPAAGVVSVPLKKGAPVYVMEAGPK